MTHAIPPPQPTWDVTLVKGPGPSGLAEGHRRALLLARRGTAPRRCWAGAGARRAGSSLPSAEVFTKVLRNREAAPAGQADIFLPACLPGSHMRLRGDKGHA